MKVVQGVERGGGDGTSAPLADVGDRDRSERSGPQARPWRRRRRHSRPAGRSRPPARPRRGRAARSTSASAVGRVADDPDCTDRDGASAARAIAAALRVEPSGAAGDLVEQARRWRGSAHPRRPSPSRRRSGAPRSSASSADGDSVRSDSSRRREALVGGGVDHARHHFALSWRPRSRSRPARA